MRFVKRRVTTPIETCTCRRGSEGFSYDPPTGLWVHAECRRPTKAYLEGTRASRTA